MVVNQGRRTFVAVVGREGGRKEVGLIESDGSAYGYQQTLCFVLPTTLATIYKQSVQFFSLLQVMEEEETSNGGKTAPEELSLDPQEGPDPLGEGSSLDPQGEDFNLDPQAELDYEEEEELVEVVEGAQVSEIHNANL